MDAQKRFLRQVLGIQARPGESQGHPIQGGVIPLHEHGESVRVPGHGPHGQFLVRLLSSHAYPLIIVLLVAGEKSHTLALIFGIKCLKILIMSIRCRIPRHYRKTSALAPWRGYRRGPV